MPKNLRVTRTRNRVFPYAWRCTIPDPEQDTGQCGAGFVAETEAQVAKDHAAHVKDSHTEETP